MRALTVGGSLEKLYAFFFSPPPPEMAVNGWKIYDSLREYERMGVGGRTNDWRISKINNSYTVGTGLLTCVPLGEEIY